MMPSASQIALAMACPASAILPRVERESAAATRGTKIHKFVADAIMLGVGEALEIAPARSRAKYKTYDIQALRGLLGESVRAEVACAWDAETDTARIIGDNIGRDYGDLKPSEFPGTADLVGACILDVKTGKWPVPPARLNWQIAHNVLAISRALGLDTVTAGLAKLQEDGTWAIDLHTFDALDIDLIAHDLRALYLRLRAGASHGAETRPDPDGACLYCDSRPNCPEYAHEQVQAAL